MINDLIVSIGRQLNIPQSDDNEWVCRVVYSVAGQMALASLWDHTEDGGSVSIQHFKSRIDQIFDAYEGIYPKIGFLLPHDKTDLIEEIYSIYLSAKWVLLSFRLSNIPSRSCNWRKWGSCSSQRYFT